MYSEREKSLFIKWMNSKNLRGGLFDLDDCLVRTSRDVFDWGFGKFFRFVIAKHPKVQITEIREAWNVANTHKYNTVGVRRDRWDVAIKILEARLNVDGLIEGLPILQDCMYNRIPRWVKGAEELLALMKSNQKQVVVVSHGDEEWTNRKVEGIGLDKLADVILCADPKEYRSKTSEHWQEGLKQVGLNANEVFGTGDNIMTDILAMRAIGVTCLAYVFSPWHIYASGDLPFDITRLKNIGRLIPFIAKITE